jgi:hypothetical protein
MQAIASRNRSIVYRTRGQGHGGITRLMSPSDLGESLKPFVFLDIFNMERPLLEAMRAGAGMSSHPHSGIATVTVLTEGRMNGRVQRDVCRGSPGGHPADDRGRREHADLARSDRRMAARLGPD